MSRTMVANGCGANSTPKAYLYWSFAAITPSAEIGTSLDQNSYPTFACGETRPPSDQIPETRVRVTSSPRNAFLSPVGSRISAATAKPPSWCRQTWYLPKIATSPTPDVLLFGSVENASCAPDEVNRPPWPLWLTRIQGMATPTSRLLVRPTCAKPTTVSDDIRMSTAEYDAARPRMFCASFSSKPS